MRDEVYMYQAALWCPDCIRNKLINDHNEVLVKWPDLFAGGGHLVSTEDMLREVLTFAGRDPDNESTWDSDDFPKGPYPDGGGEADTPQHCDGCSTFLHNPLTDDGYAYVADALEQFCDDNRGDRELLTEWARFYLNENDQLDNAIARFDAPTNDD